MTDRDTFAAAALTGLLASDPDYGDSLRDQFARFAFRLADAMLAARGDKPPSPAADARPEGDVGGREWRWVEVYEMLQSGDAYFDYDRGCWMLVAQKSGVPCWSSFKYRRRITTDLEAAPAATASGRDSSAEAGTGDARAAPEPAAWAVYDGEADEEPLVLCFKEHRARDEVRGVAGSRVVPLYAAPPAPGVTLTDAEREAVEFAATQCSAFGLTNTAATLRGLLARAAKEGGR